MLDIKWGFAHVYMLLVEKFQVLFVQGDIGFPGTRGARGPKVNSFKFCCDMTHKLKIFTFIPIFFHNISMIQGLPGERGIVGFPGTPGSPVNLTLNLKVDFQWTTFF